jgi:hypothetical protein
MLLLLLLLLLGLLQPRKCSHCCHGLLCDSRSLSPAAPGGHSHWDMGRLSTAPAAAQCLPGRCHLHANDWPGPTQIYEGLPPPLLLLHSAGSLRCQTCCCARRWGMLHMRTRPLPPRPAAAAAEHPAPGVQRRPVLPATAVCLWPTAGLWSAPAVQGGRAATAPLPPPQWLPPAWPAAPAATACRCRLVAGEGPGHGKGTPGGHPAAPGARCTATMPAACSSSTTRSSTDRHIHCVHTEWQLLLGKHVMPHTTCCPGNCLADIACMLQQRVVHTLAHPQINLSFLLLAHPAAEHVTADATC